MCKIIKIIKQKLHDFVMQPAKQNSNRNELKTIFTANDTLIINFHLWLL